MDAERGEGVGKRLPSSNLYGYSRMNSGWWIELQRRSYGK